MFSSLRSRLWLSYALMIITALLVVAVIFIIYLLGNPLVYRETRLRLVVVLNELASTQVGWSNLPPDQVQPALQKLDTQLDARLLLVNPKRQIIADSRGSSAAALETRPFFRLLRLNQTVVDAKGQAWMYALRKLDNGNFLVAAVPRPVVSLWNILTDELMPPLLWAGGLALVLALFIAFWMARWVADPLQRVVNAAHQFSGTEAQPLPLQGPQEVRELVGAFNNMTSRVQASQQAQRDFVANVSHELKTPLTSIQGFSQALLDGTAADPAGQKQAAQVIYDEAGRMHRMVLDLLDLARLDAGIADLKHEPLDLPALLNAAARRFAPQVSQAGVQLELQPAPILPAISGDGDRLAQALNNLLDNALKFTPAGGRVTLGLSAAPGGAELRVADNGAGISPEALEHIFDRFYQADASRKGGLKHGAGLGLAIAREIVRAHGGKISVRSAVGKGSEFVIWLPVVKPAETTLVHRKK